MRLLIVHAHPLTDSLNAELNRATLAEARARGHEVQVLDLHAMGFNPVMSAEERRGYETDAIPPDLLPHIEALRWAEGLIFVYPTWWYSQPAMLKGWLDRVWRPGVAFTLHDQAPRLRPALPGIRLLGVVTSFGSPWWFWTFLIGAPGRKVLLRGLRPCIARNARTFWLGLHEIDTRDRAACSRFIARVRARIAAIPL